jgi:hypothetical protein
MKYIILLLSLLSFSVNADEWQLSLSPGHPHQCASIGSNGSIGLWINSKYGFRCEYGVVGESRLVWGNWSGAEFAITTPKNYRPTSVRHSIFQIWQQADPCDNVNRGTPLAIVVEDGYFELVVNRNSDECAGFTKGISTILNPTQSIEPNKTYNFVISTLWNTEDGVTRVIMNGEEVAYITNGVGFNDKSMPVYAFGIYAWPWRNINNRPIGQVIQYSFTFPKLIW